MKSPSEWSPRARKLGEFALVLVLLCATLALTFRVVLSGDEDLAGRFDVYRAAGPLAYYMDDRIHDGEFPFWNPLTYLGMPYAANPVSAALYPPNILRSLLTFDPTPLKTQTGWVVLMALHLLIAGLGMHYLARDHKLGFCASFAAALVFVFSAVWVRRVSEYHFITLVGWVPWLLLITRHAMRQPGIRGKALAGAGCALIVGNALLSGAINIAPYLGVAIGSYALFYRLSLITGSLRPRWRAIMGTLTGDALLLGLMFTLGACIAAPLLFSGSELSSFSSRAEGSDYTLPPPVYGGTWTQLFHDLIRYPGVKWNPEDIRGAGIAALFLALAGLGHRSFRALFPALGLFVVLFDCSMGRPWPVATVVDSISPLQMVSSTRAFDFALIPLGLLAAFGIDALTGPRAIRPIVFWGIALIGGACCLYALYPIFPGTDYMPMPRAAFYIPVVALAIAAVAPWLPGKRLIRVLLVAFIFAETFSWSTIYVPSLVIRPNFATWAGDYDGSAPFWPDNRRGTDEVPNRHLYDLRAVINGYEPVHIARVREVAASERRLQRYSRMLDHDEVTLDNPRGNQFLKRAFWLAREYAAGPLPARNFHFPAATTVFLDTNENLPVTRVEADEVRNRSYSASVRRTPILAPGADQPYTHVHPTETPESALELPPFSVPPQHSVLSIAYRSESRAILEIRFTDKDSGLNQWGERKVIADTNGALRSVEIPLPDYPNVQATAHFKLRKPGGKIEITGMEVITDLLDETNHIEIVERKANTVRVRVRDLPAPRILTFIDAAYPGWSATVDGAAVPLYLANDAFKAVVVPEGTHEIEFRYRPAKLLGGAGLSSATILAIILLLAVGRSAKRLPLSHRG